MNGEFPVSWTSGHQIFVAHCWDKIVKMRSIFLPILLALLIEQRSASPDPSMTQLLNERLFKSYNKYIRPGAFHTNTTTIELGLAPLYLTDLDEEKSTFTLESRLKLVWNDDRLIWDEAEFMGIKVIRVSNSFPWLPDIVVYNSPSEKYDPKKDSNVLVYSSGKVLWVPPTTIVTICPLKTEDGYSDDLQTCEIKLGSWTNDGWLVDLSIDKKELDFTCFYDVNPHWEVLKDQCNISRVVVKYPCCEEPYITASAMLALKRRPVDHFRVVKLPCFVVLILMLFMFWMPPRHGQKIILGSCLILILTTLLVYVASNIKNTKDKAKTVCLLRSSVILVMSATIVEVILLSVMRCLGSCIPPKFLPNIFFSAMKKLPGFLSASKKSDTNANFHEGEEEDVKVANSHCKISKKDQTPPKEWVFLGEAIEKILFVIFAVISMSLFC